MIIHEVVLIDDVLRDYAECNLVVLMLMQWVVEVVVLEIKYYVFGAWGIYDSVPV